VRFTSSSDVTVADPGALGLDSDSMTIAASPARLSAREILVSRLQATKFPADRIVLAGAFVLLFSLNYAGNLIDAVTNAVAVDNDLVHSRTASGAEILGFVAIAVVLRDFKTDRVLRWWDLLAIIGIAIASLYPSPVSRAVAMTCLGLLFIPRTDERIASLGQLCVGLVWLDFWGPLVLNLIGRWVLPVETALAYLPLSLYGSFSMNGLVISNGSGFSIEVLEPCSAFHNTIIAAFIWLSLIKIQRLRFQIEHYVVLAIGLVGVVLLNTARIGIMAVSKSEYLFWHMGPGLWIIKIAMLAGVLSLFYFGLRPAQQRVA
jgi:hypothetical protein